MRLRRIKRLRNGPRAEFCNVRAYKQQLPILPYTYMFYSNIKMDGKLGFWR